MQTRLSFIFKTSSRSCKRIVLLWPKCWQMHFSTMHIFPWSCSHCAFLTLNQSRYCPSAHAFTPCSKPSIYWITSTSVRLFSRAYSWSKFQVSCSIKSNNNGVLTCRWEIIVIEISQMPSTKSYLKIHSIPQSGQLPN